jgi:hypothetical protein
MKNKYYFILEKVVTQINKRTAYSFPDALPENQIKELIAAIDGDLTLQAMVRGEKQMSDPEDSSGKTLIQGTKEAIWNRLRKVAPNIYNVLYDTYKHFRIASTRMDKDGFREDAYPQQREEDEHSTRPFDYYDSLAQTDREMPSFADFMVDPAYGRQSEVSGGGPKVYGYKK